MTTPPPIVSARLMTSRAAGRRHYTSMTSIERSDKIERNNPPRQRTISRATGPAIKPTPHNCGSLSTTYELVCIRRERPSAPQPHISPPRTASIPQVRKNSGQMLVSCVRGYTPVVALHPDRNKCPGCRVIWQKAAWPTCRPSPMRMDSSDLNPIQCTVPWIHMSQPSHDISIGSDVFARLTVLPEPAKSYALRCFQ